MRTQNKNYIFDHPKQNSIKDYVKTLLQLARILIYRLITFFCYKKIDDKKYNVSVGAIFKNEECYLKEWIEYNKIAGIDHFYLYNNNSTDKYNLVLQPYIESGLVTLVDWPYQQQQMEAYMDCIDKYSCESKWIGFIDIDEFVVPISTNSVYDFLKKFEKKHGSVLIYWKLFGSSGLISRDTKRLVTEDFTVCWPKHCNIGKCFYNTAFEFSRKNIGNSLHHCLWTTFKNINIPPVNIFDRFCVGGVDTTGIRKEEFPIQINHYFTKSYEEYMAKCAKGDVYFKINPHDEEYFYKHENKCSDVDYSAYKYLINLKTIVSPNIKEE